MQCMFMPVNYRYTVNTSISSEVGCARLRVQVLTLLPSPRTPLGTCAAQLIFEETCNYLQYLSHSVPLTYYTVGHGAVQ